MIPGSKVSTRKKNGHNHAILHCWIHRKLTKFHCFLTNKQKISSVGIRLSNAL